MCRAVGEREVPIISIFRLSSIEPRSYFLSTNRSLTYPKTLALVYTCRLRQSRELLGGIISHNSMETGTIKNFANDVVALVMDSLYGANHFTDRTPPKKNSLCFFTILSYVSK